MRNCRPAFWPAVSRWQAASAPRTGRTEEAKAASHDRDLCAHLAALGTGPPATAQRISSEVPVVGSRAPARRPRRPVSLPNASSAPRVVGRNGDKHRGEKRGGDKFSWRHSLLFGEWRPTPSRPPPSRGRCDPAFLAQWCSSHKGAPPPRWGRLGGGAWMARYIPRPPRPPSPLAGEGAPKGRMRGPSSGIEAWAASRHSSVALMAFSPQIAPPGRFALRDGSKPLTLLFLWTRKSCPSPTRGEGWVPWVGAKAFPTVITGLVPVIHRGFAASAGVDCRDEPGNDGDGCGLPGGRENQGKEKAPAATVVGTGA